MSFKKKGLIICAVLFLVILIMPKYEFAATSEDGIWEYEVLDNNEITITGYNGSDTEITIPSSIEEKVVTEIGNGAFSECTTITNIIFPNSIKTIGLSSFEYCESLQSVRLNDGLMEIGTYAFYGCASLKSIDIPNTVTKLGTNPEILYNMGELEEGYDKDITYSAIFAECTNLEKVILPKNVTEIGVAMFSDCVSLKQVTIPEKVKAIRGGAFRECTSLESINIPESVETLGASTSDDYTGYTFYNCSNLTNIDLSKNIEVIECYSFYGCSNITNIELSEKLQKIGASAFRACGITQVKIPASVQEIGSSALACSNLKMIEVQNGNKNYLSEQGVLFDINKEKLIQYNVANEITTYAIPDGVKTIGASSFIGAKNLKSLEVPSSITEILGVLGGAGGPPSTYAFDFVRFEICYNGTQHELRNIKYALDYYSDTIGLHTWNNVHYNSITDAEKSSIEAIYEYTGSEIKPSITLETWKGILIEGTDYTITYEDNINVGTASLNVVGIGEHEGEEFSTTFDITAKSIEDITIEGLKDKMYTGKNITPLLPIKSGNVRLINGKDYEIVYKNNIKLGTAKVVITGKGNYKGTITKTFNIIPRDINTLYISEFMDLLLYTGQPLTQKKMKIELNGNFLKEGIDYSLSYKNNTNIGTATVIITGKGNYAGTITRTFKINAISFTNSKISGIKDKEYSGKNLTQSFTVQMGNKTLVKDKDYKVTYSNQKYPGKATVKITGIGNYTGTITKTFLIKPKKVTGLKANSQTTNSIKLGWTKHTGVTGYKVYSYNYKKSKWEYVGKTSSTSYTIKKLKAGTTYKYRVRAYKTIDGTQYFGSYTSSLKTSTKTKTPSISKLTTKSKKATIKWKKVSGASGYQIYMATSKNGKYSKIKTITKGSTTSYTKTKLKKNKKYYFKIRTYRTVDGKKVYSSYSSVKSIKVK